MDLVKTRTELQRIISLIEKGRKMLSERANNKANTIGIYRKKLASTLIQLKNGVAFNVDGEIVSNVPATTSLAIAHGICFQEKINMELAEAEYKNAIVSLEMLKVQLNGIQSINKYSEEI